MIYYTWVPVGTIGRLMSVAHGLYTNPMDALKAKGFRSHNETEPGSNTYNRPDHGPCHWFLMTIQQD